MVAISNWSIIFVFDNEIVVNVIVGVCVQVNNFGIIRNPSLFCKISSFLNWVAVKIIFDVKRKKVDWKKQIIEVCVKRCQNIFYWVKKKTCLGCFIIEEIRDKHNETGLKEGGGIEMSIYSASIHSNDNYNLV